MRLLLDTHVLIWLDIAKNRLSVAAQQAIQDRENSIYLSLVSVWEMQIKIQLGKLHLNASLSATLAAHQQTNGIQLLSMQLSYILALSQLPQHHHDPFDRLLIAQAQVEGLTLVSNDAKIQQYSVPLLW
jgi:PIN domain nuclease of toxin-antitoxin system